MTGLAEYNHKNKIDLARVTMCVSVLKEGGIVERTQKKSHFSKVPGASTSFAVRGKLPVVVKMLMSKEDDALVDFRKWAEEAGVTVPTLQKHLARCVDEGAVQVATTEAAIQLCLDDDEGEEKMASAVKTALSLFAYKQKCSEALEDYVHGSRHGQCLWVKLMQEHDDDTYKKGRCGMCLPCTG